MPIRRITRPRTWSPPEFSRELSAASVTLERTNPNHIAAASGGSQFATDESGHYEIRPRGNSVSHEDEMMKVAANQMDYEAATELYTHSLNLIKLAIKE